MDYSAGYVKLYEKKYGGLDVKADRGKIRRTRFKIMADIIKNRYRSKKIKILDYGASDGWFSEFLEKNSQYYYLDIATNQKTYLKPGDRVLTFTKNWKIPTSEKFDVVILSEVIEHLPNPTDVLLDIKRVMNKGGILIITTPNMFYSLYLLKSIFGFYIDKSKQHVNLYDYSILTNHLESCGYKIVEKRLFVFFAPLFHTLGFFDNILAKIFQNNCLQLVIVFRVK